MTLGTKIIDRNQSPVQSYGIMDYTNFCYGPGYITSNYYAATGIGHIRGTNSINGAFVVSTLYYYPFFCMQTKAFSKIAMYSVVGAGNVVMGIYANGVGIPTGNPLPNSNSGSIASTSSTMSTFTFSSPITLTGNTWYWLAVTASSASCLPASAVVLGGSDEMTNGLGEATLNASNNQIMGYTQSFAFSTTLPTAGSLTAITAATNHLNLVWLQV